MTPSSQLPPDLFYFDDLQKHHMASPGKLSYRGNGFAFNASRQMSDGIERRIPYAAKGIAAFVASKDWHGTEQ